MLTQGERQTLETILRHGGKVVLTRGKKRTPECVHLGTAERMEARGLVRMWNDKVTKVRWDARRKAWVRAANGFSPQTYMDLAVTAAGCRALAGIE